MDVLPAESAAPVGSTVARPTAPLFVPPGRAVEAPLAAIAAALWSRALKFDATDPDWPDRDRFVVSARDGDRLAFLPPEMSGTPAEPLSGRAGDGIAAALGMALAERLLAARFGKSLVDHRTWVLADADCGAAGISQEAASIAGRLRLEKLAILLRADGADPAEVDDAARRFAVCGWAVQRVGAPDGLASALSFALRAKKPTLIAVEVAQAGEVAADDGERWQRAGRSGAPARRAWLKRLTRHVQRTEFERAMEGRLLPAWQEALAGVKPGLCGDGAASCADAGRAILTAIASALPEFLGGFAGAAAPAGLQPVRRDGFAGRAVLYGGRVQAAVAAAAGMAIHGGLLPVAACAAGDLAALRQAAVRRRRMIQIVSETPAADLAGLRATPGLLVLRPADALETAECWELALRREDGPSLLVLSEAPAPGRAAEAANRCVRGGYVLAEAEGERQATLIAGGSEVAAALTARELLANRVAVVSLPCWELFARMPAAYREEVLGRAPRFGLAGCGFGWERWLGADGVFVSLPEPLLLPEGEAAGTGPVADAIVVQVRKRVDFTPECDVQQREE